MRLTLSVLVPAIVLTMAGLAFAVAVCLTTAAVVWAVYGLVRALPEPVPAPAPGPDRRQ